MVENNLEINPGKISLADLEKIWCKSVNVEVASDSEVIQKSRDVIKNIVDNETITYGVNTGFGRLADINIPQGEVENLQRNLIRSHCAGVGEPFTSNVVRILLILKASSLAQGYSGVRPVVIERIMQLYNNQVIPYIPQQGSVGASGDLAPLSHMAAVLIGEGQAFVGNELVDGAAALHKINTEPLILKAKEGLALINGTQVSTALALDGLLQIRQVFNAAIVAGAISTVAFGGSDKPFDSRIQEIRRQKGQIKVAKIYKQLLKDCVHANGKVQDPYCLRCQPQVMGACLDVIDYAIDIFTNEANAVSDNPLVFADEDEVISGGNFHAEPVAIASDMLAIAAAEIGSLAERRIAMLIDNNLSGLPAFLVQDSGLNSGFMIAHVTAASLASENKTLAHPASIDSIPTSANQEDHVSMATFAARKLNNIANNIRNIIAIEILAAVQGVELREQDAGRVLVNSEIKSVIDKVRQEVAYYSHDRQFTQDINKVAQLIRLGAFEEFIA